jgi:hypothetical protein
MLCSCSDSAESAHQGPESNATEEATTPKADDDGLFVSYWDGASANHWRIRTGFNMCYFPVTERPLPRMAGASEDEIHRKLAAGEISPTSASWYSWPPNVDGIIEVLGYERNALKVRSPSSEIGYVPLVFTVTHEWRHYQTDRGLPAREIEVDELLKEPPRGLFPSGEIVSISSDVVIALRIPELGIVEAQPVMCAWYYARGDGSGKLELRLVFGLQGTEWPDDKWDAEFASRLDYRGFVLPPTSLKPD